MMSILIPRRGLRMRNEISNTVDWLFRLLLLTGVMLLWIFGGFSFWTVFATITVLCLFYFDVTNSI